MNDAITITDELVQRASFYRTFSLLFRFPDDDLIELIKEGTAELPLGVLDNVSTDRIIPFQAQVADTDLSQLRTEYSQLFTGAGLCRTNENDYEKLSFSMTEKLADVAGFYEAFGFELSEGLGERPDFIGAEMDFARLLLLKQAYAEAQGWDQRADVTAESIKTFLSAHIVEWIPKLCYALEELADDDGVYFTAAIALNVFIESEARRLVADGS